MPKLKIEVSEKMVEFLNKNTKNMKFHYYTEPARYYSCVFDYIGSERVRKILVTYPPEYYAYPHQLTTMDLLECYQYSNGTMKDFRKKVYEMVEI